MYTTLRRLHLEGRLTVEGLDNAVLKGWITQQQKEDIIQAKDALDSEEDDEIRID